MKIHGNAIDITTPENEPFVASLSPSSPLVPSFCLYAEQGRRLYGFSIRQGKSYWQCEITDFPGRELAKIVKDSTAIYIANDHMDADVKDGEITLKNASMLATFTSDKNTLKSVKVEIYASSLEASEAHAEKEPQPGPEGDS